MSDKKKIDRLIEKEKPSSFFWHFISGFWYKGYVFGEKLNSKEYIIWTSNNFTGSSHPIFKIVFDSEGMIRELKNELNPFGRIFSFFLKFSAITFLCLFVYTNYNETADLYGSLSILFIFGTLFLVFYLLSRRIYKNELKYLSNELKVTLEVVKKEEIQKKEDEINEWSLSSILLRLVTYSLCFIFILISVWMFFQGEFISSFVIFPIVSTYLYYDIKILSRKNKLNKK